MAATHRTIEALRRLAERPGYYSEGALAAQRLAELQTSKPELFTLSPKFHHFTWARCETVSLCGCGAMYDIHVKCGQHLRHEHMRLTIGIQFPKGSRVYYNRWAYAHNCEATVLGMPRPDLDNWAWIRLQFDHLKSPRNVPIYSDKGLHLSLAPLDSDECRRLSNP